MKTIIIVVSPDGSTAVETVGFSGSDCREASRQLEAALGHATAERLKPEFHLPTQHSQNQTQQH